MVAAAGRKDCPAAPGLDVSTIPAFREAIEDALDTGNLAVSESYELVLSGRLGIVAVLPLETDPGEASAVVAARMHIDELIAEAVPKRLQTLFEISLQPAGGPPTPTPLTAYAVVEFGGRLWTFTVEAR